MAVHVPLSAEAQAEARLLMMSSNNILNPKDGRPVAIPTQDMVLGCYYLTTEKNDAPGQGKCFKDPEEAVMAYNNDAISLHARIKVRIPGLGLVETTVGRVIFNEELPEKLRYMEWNGFYNHVADKKALSMIVDKCYRKLGFSATTRLLDGVKRLGFTYASKAGVTIGINDITIPEEKADILKDAGTQVEKVETQFRRGLITEEERYQTVIGIWNEATKKVTDALIESLDRFNPVYMMANSGARGNIQQIRQLAGMRGLMADPSGQIIDLPIKANFREGLTVLEYFISTHGARKGLADTALRTADSGYLTRRLVDVAQDVIVREKDCFTTQGIEVAEIKDGTEVIEKIEDRINGRITLEDIIHPVTGEVLAKADTEITEEEARAIIAAGITKVKIRSVLTCRTRYGVCVKCYGRNLATGHMVDIGEAVGIIAAQSIGEPGTQLTIHTGGVAGDDITQGLPRVEELFEARKPKGQAIVAEADGTAEVREAKGRREIDVITEDGEKETYPVPYGARLKIKDGDRIYAGDELTEGSVNPHDLLKIKGIQGVQVYLLQEVQRVYRLQGVDINDKHIEVMIRQMLRRVKVEEPGDTDLLPGGLIDIFEFEDENNRITMNGGEPATAKTLLMGITKASLATDSFLSAASFQETTRVLTDAAIKGKLDPLLGLKENVIIGKLVPAGTGMSRYRNIEIDAVEDDPGEENIIGGEEMASQGIDNVL
ncbi:MAG: DNA-directed RNA polymerase subunit beta' [Firmicutes bacterium ADurb.Bin373]|nr:MAG: DNA-directed RNA polymerase subunit beta' [Firmicutes bacterium ADurb.Bin373]